MHRQFYPPRFDHANIFLNSMHYVSEQCNSDLIGSILRAAGIVTQKFRVRRLPNM